MYWQLHWVRILLAVRKWMQATKMEIVRKCKRVNTEQDRENRTRPNCKKERETYSSRKLIMEAIYIWGRVIEIEDKKEEQNEKIHQEEEKEEGTSRHRYIWMEWHRNSTRKVTNVTHITAVSCNNILGWIFAFRWYQGEDIDIAFVVFKPFPYRPVTIRIKIITI